MDFVHYFTKKQITLRFTILCICYSVQFSHSVVSDSLWPHEPQHTRLPHPSPTPGVYPNSCPLSQWCHLTILSSVVPFSSCLQSFSTSGFILNELVLLSRWPKYWSFSFNISLPVNTQDWFPLGWTGWISFQSKELSRVFHLLLAHIIAQIGL